MDSEPPLSARGVSKRYGRGGRWALRDIDLDVPAGGIVLLVGPNGAGKSTLIRGWTGFEKPTAGSLKVFGHDAWRARSDALQRIGYVAQFTPVYRRLSVADHLALARASRPRFDRPSAEHRLAGLGIPLQAKAGRLSGGQQAQLSLALALGTQADVLLLDEPLAALDPLARREFMSNLLDAVRRGGTTVVLSSHIVSDLGGACTHLIVLGEGRVLLSGPIDSIRSEHVVTTGATPENGTPVGSFPTDNGQRAVLFRRGEPRRNTFQPERVALDEIVLGYLASSRDA